MIAWLEERDPGLGPRAVAGLLGCLLLTVCAASNAPTKWTKTGIDDPAMARELRDCTSQANAALANEQGINQDINATLGGNWQLSRTTGIVDQSMREQATGYSDQILNSCMRAKGFTKES